MKKTIANKLIDLCESCIAFFARLIDRLHNMTS